MKVSAFCVAIVACVLSMTAAGADDTKNVATNPVSTTPLIDVLDSVRRQTGGLFLIDRRVEANIVTGQLKIAEIDYSSLLLVLRNNGLAAIKSGGTTNIIPVAYVRQYALPVLFDEDNSIDEEEWVTRVLKVQHAQANQMVPILRPLLPQPGHLVAHAHSNTLTIVARYGNVRRIVTLIRSYDRETSQ